MTLSIKKSSLLLLITYSFLIQHIQSRNFLIAEKTEINIENIQKNIEIIDDVSTTNLSPETYNIYLSANLNPAQNFTFKGCIELELRVLISTNKIVLNYGKITVQSIIVTDGETKLNIIQQQYDQMTEQYTIVFDSALKVGSIITIKIIYHGKLADDATGFYKESYVDINGNLKWFAATQYKNTRVRDVFPCFDEFKQTAKIKMYILRGESQLTASNMALYTTKPIHNKKLIWDIYNSREAILPNEIEIFIADSASLPEIRRELYEWAESNSNDNVQYTSSSNSLLCVNELVNDLICSSDETIDNEKYRLPITVIPNHYKIHLRPYITPNNFTFDGSVEINTTAVSNSSKIYLHANEIEIAEVLLTVNEKSVDNIFYHEDKYNLLTIVANETIMIDTEVIISINYKGKLNSDMRGFYRSSYTYGNNERKWLAATHLEPVGARNMFPCFDEPALKATFQISVIRSADYKAISNTPLETSIKNGDDFLDTFEKTPLMSTYLVALVVSDFNFTMINQSYSAYARPNAINQTIYAASVMKPIVDYFEKYLGHPYQLTKLDMIALPDFGSGAMENWGLITYRESNMLYHPEYSSITTKQSIAAVIAHEISHQWFGNLVSPQWWNYTWLSEGFARYFQYHATAQIEPEWGLEYQFVIEQLQSAFAIDAQPSSHPMTHNVYSPAEISGIFDQISYNKGGSILRMVEKTFGAELFFSALHDYLKARQYKDGTPEFLFEAFQDQVNKNGTVKLNIKKIMNSWTTQAGYPVVDVEIHNNVVSLTQQRFLLTKSENENFSERWSIPITYTFESKPDFSDTTPKYWLSTERSSFILNYTEFQADDWIIFNIQEAGYYRVKYDENSWDRIVKVLKSKDFMKIHELNRAALIDDVLNLARAGYVDYFDALKATQYLTQETDYIPWKAALNGLSYLNKKFTGKPIYDLFKVHIKTILTPIYNKLGFNEMKNDTHYDKLLRKTVINWACEFGIEDCIEKSSKLFTTWRSDSSKLVPVNMRSTIYCTAIKYGTESDYDFLWNKYLTTDNPAEKNVIINALGCSQNSSRLEIFLSSAINTNNSPFRSQDIGSVFSSVYTSGIFGAQCALNFTTSHYEDMYKYFGNYDDVANIIGSISAQLSTKELVLQLQGFVENNLINSTTAVKSLDSFVTRAHEELTWYDKSIPRIFEWLDTTYESSDYRLPKSISPIAYTIFLSPNLENDKFTFDGSVTIRMNVNENITSIVLHANELKINNIYDMEVETDRAKLDISNYSMNSLTQKLTIYLTTTVNAATVLTLSIQYSGKLNEKMVGFYRSYYEDDNGTIHWLASTQFQKYGARQAFPCFDEPSFKAKFTVNIERPNHYHTLSNMPLRTHGLSDKNNHTWDYYMESEQMSSYLVAFIVSDFVYLSNENENFKVWSRPNAIESAKSALDIGQKSLSFLEKYTGINYPISKMDLAAIPDFAAGAMENWGLVTFREYGLLTSENITSAVYMRYMATTIAHELVHMWFGDLVTCDWWEYVWLNEGFAEYLEYLVIDSIYPEWNMEQHFISYELQTALLKDSFPHMRAMNNKMTTPYDEGKDFTSIAYAKSASVIHMMHRAFGEEIFAKGLHTYLHKNKYKTSKPEYLWSALQYHVNENGGLNVTNVSVATLMDSWASQPGYPVVHANLSRTLLSLTQKRFLVTEKNDTDNTQLYWIPITIATKSKPNFNNPSIVEWLGKRKQMVYREDFNRNEWFILNVQQSGYYRVNYETDNWNNLIKALNEDNFGGIPEINRAQIIDDILNLARAEYVSYELAIIATQYLTKEFHHLPWKAFFSAYAYLHERFDGHEVGTMLHEYILKLIENVYEKLGFEDNLNDTQLTKTNRQLILSWACKLSHDNCVETSKKLFALWRNDTNIFISPNVKSTVICTALKHGNYDDWTFAWEQYRKSNFESDKIGILNALGCSENTTAINQYFDVIFSKDGLIRDQNIGAAFGSVYSAGKFGVNASIEFLTSNYKKIYTRYGEWDSVANFFSNVATKFSTKKEIDHLQHFVNKTSEDLKEISKSLETTLTDAKNSMEFFNKHGVVFKNLLTLPPTTSSPNGGGGGSETGNFSNNINPTVSILILSILTVLIFAFN